MRVLFDLMSKPLPSPLDSWPYSARSRTVCHSVPVFSRRMRFGAGPIFSLLEWAVLASSAPLFVVKGKFVAGEVLVFILSLLPVNLNCSTPPPRRRPGAPVFLTVGTAIGTNSESELCDAPDAYMAIGMVDCF